MSGIVEINWKPTERVLRQFGAIALLSFGVLAFSAWNSWWWFSGGSGGSRTSVAAVLAGAALFSGVASLLAPRAHLPLFLGLSLVSYPVGFVVSYVIMAALFYLVFAPVAMVMRLLGRDPLSRNADATARSYWRPVEDGRDPNRYFRQF